MTTPERSPPSSSTRRRRQSADSTTRRRLSSDDSTTRRRLLASVAASLAAAGCLGRGGPAGDDGSPTASPDDTSTPDHHTGGSSYLDLRARVADVEAEWAREYAALGEEAQAVVDDAVDGTGTYESWEGPLLADGGYLERDGSYYRVRESKVGERDVEGHRMELETLTVDGEAGDWTSPGTVSEARERAVDFADLSAVDRRIVREGVGEEYRGERGFASSYPVEVGEEAAENATLLSDEPRYVRYEGELLSIYREEAEDLVAVVYEYDLQAVVDDADAFVDLVEREHVLDLDAADLSADERALFESATEATVERTSPFSETVESLLDRLRDHQRNPLNRDPYASFDGEVYRVEIMLAVP